MTAALSPELAIAYVRELSADVRDAVVLAGNGAVLAGNPALAPAALAFGAALGDGTDAAVRAECGVVFGARTAAHTLLVVASKLTLEAPTRLDTLAAVRALDPDRKSVHQPVNEMSTALEQAADAAIRAVNRH